MFPNHTVQMMLHLMSLLVPLIARQYSDLPTTTRVEVLLIKKKNSSFRSFNIQTLTQTHLVLTFIFMYE